MNAAATSTPINANSTTADTLPTCLNFTAWLVETLTIAFMIVTLIIVLNSSSRLSMEFQPNSTLVSPFIVYSSSLTANWYITSLARNNYKDKSIYYDVMQVSVFYHKEFLSMTNVVANGTTLHQDPIPSKNEMQVRASVSASLVFAKDCVAAAMVEDLRDGIVGLNLAMQGAFRVEGGSHPPSWLLRVDCDFVRVEMSNNGTDGALFGGSSKCDVHVEGDYI